MSITVEQLEKAAKAAFEAFWGLYYGNVADWDAQGETYKNNWRSVARAVLESQKAEQERAA